MCHTTSKHLEANFKNLLGMELVTDVVFLVLSLENNDLTIYVFATGVSCKIRSLGSTELKNVHILVLGLTVQSASVPKKPRCSD